MKHYCSIWFDLVAVKFGNFVQGSSPPWSGQEGPIQPRRAPSSQPPSRACPLPAASQPRQPFSRGLDFTLICLTSKPSFWRLGSSSLSLVSLLRGCSAFTRGRGLRPHHGVTQSAASTLTHCRRPAPGDCLPPQLDAALRATQTGCRAHQANPARALLCFAACRVLFSLLANSRAAGPLL